MKKIKKKGKRIAKSFKGRASRLHSGQAPRRALSRRLRINRGKRIRSTIRPSSLKFHRKQTRPKVKRGVLTKKPRRPKIGRGLRRVKRKISPLKRISHAKRKQIKKPVRRTRKLASLGRMMPHYGLNPQFVFFDELRNLVLKFLPASTDRMAKRVNGLGRVKLAIISGVFLNLENPSVADLLIVGEDIDRRKLRAFLKDAESEVGAEIAFSLMDREEFEYRRRMFDRFLRVLLEGPHEVLIDKVGL